MILELVPEKGGYISFLSSYEVKILDKRDFFLL